MSLCQIKESVMLLYILLFSLMLYAVNGTWTYDPSYFDQAKMEQLYLCSSAVLCDERRADEFLKVTDAAVGKECQDGVFHALKEGYDMTVESTLEYWEIFIEKHCPENRPKRIERFKNFAAPIGESFQNHNCEIEPEQPVCLCYCEVFEQMEEIINRYEAMGKCGRKAEFKKVLSSG